MSRWDFDVWFIAQHGPRPAITDEALLRASIQAQEIRLGSDRSLLRRIEEWEARRITALYAWQIKDADKVSK
jgi:hypothetical protein